MSEHDFHFVVMDPEDGYDGPGGAVATGSVHGALRLYKVKEILRKIAGFLVVNLLGLKLEGPASPTWPGYRRLWRTGNGRVARTW